MDRGGGKGRQNSRSEAWRARRSCFLSLSLSLSLSLFHLMANCCIGFISIKGNGGNARRSTERRRSPRSYVLAADLKTEKECAEFKYQSDISLGHIFTPKMRKLFS